MPTHTPSLSRGRGMKTSKERVDWIKQEQDKHFCQCGCGKLIKITWQHCYRDIPIYIRGHYPRSKEEKERSSKAREGDKCYWWGRKLSDGHKKKLSDAKRDDTKWVNVTCQFCGKERRILISHLKYGHGKYCSKSCRRRHQKFPTHHTKPELIFEQICKKNNLPFKYTGNGSFWIGKKGEKQLNPDFIEANGKKICIEIFGDYWHSPLFNQNMNIQGTYAYRKRHFKRYKWEVIFFWETDLLREDAETFVL